MKDSKSAFLDASACDRIRDAVAKAEQGTSGEIVVMVVPESYHYPMANLFGAVALAFPSALALTPVLGKALWAGTWSLWVFLGLFALLFAAFHETVRRTGFLKRWFISRQELADEVEEAAIRNFFSEELFRTRQRNAVLLFVSVLERMVWLLPDKGVREKPGNGVWKEIVDDLSAGIRGRDRAGAMCLAVQRVGAVLAEHFPPGSGDGNELESLWLR